MPGPRETETDAGRHAPPARKPDGSLTRAGMEAAIRRGGAVIHKGVHYKSLADLPDEATITEGDAQASAAAKAALDAQIAALATQRAALGETHARNVEADEKKAREKAEADFKAAEEAAAKKAAKHEPPKK